MTLYNAAKDLHDYLWENVPDIIDIATNSDLAGEGVRKRLQALKTALNATHPVKLAEDRHTPWIPTKEQPRFDELTLRDEIAKVWGAHGAHSEIYRMLLQDKARYRWLRDKSRDQYERPICVSQNRVERGMQYIGPLCGSELDAAIDTSLDMNKSEHKAP